MDSEYNSAQRREIVSEFYDGNLRKAAKTEGPLSQVSDDRLSFLERFLENPS